MTRQEANLKILEVLSKEVETYPHLRLNQILINLQVTEVTDIYDIHGEVIDTENTLDYYEEPVVTLTRVLGE